MESVVASPTSKCARLSFFATLNYLLQSPFYSFSGAACSPPPFCSASETHQGPLITDWVPCDPELFCIYLHSCTFCLSHQNLTSSSNSQRPKTLFQIYNLCTTERQQNDSFILYNPFSSLLSQWHIIIFWACCNGKIYYTR